MADNPQLDPATAAKLGNLFAGLAHNPKTRKLVAQAVREGLPDSPEARSFSDIEASERQEAWERKQEEREIKRQADEELARMNTQRARLLTGGVNGEGRKYSEDDVKSIEKLMQDRGIRDYEDGATLYAATLPPEAPKAGRDYPEVNGTTWEFPEWAKFAKDPAKASRETANQVITELMRARR